MAAALPREILDIIFANFDIESCHLRICKGWYGAAQAALLRKVRLSCRALFRLPILYTELRDLVARHTQYLEIVLESIGQDDKALEREETSFYLNESSDAYAYGLNLSLLQLAQILPSLQRLNSFIICNWIETESSWSTIRYETFSAIFIALSKLRLQYVKIDLPGAPLETRNQIYDPCESKPHCCELIRTYFPNTRHFYLRMRRICPHVLEAPGPLQDRLETFVINLTLDENHLQELDIDKHVSHCQEFETISSSLLGSMANPAQIFTRTLAMINFRKLQFVYREVCHTTPSDIQSNTLHRMQRRILWTLQGTSFQQPETSDI